MCAKCKTANLHNQNHSATLFSVPAVFIHPQPYFSLYGCMFASRKSGESGEDVA